MNGGRPRRSTAVGRSDSQPGLSPWSSPDNQAFRHKSRARSASFGETAAETRDARTGPPSETASFGETTGSTDDVNLGPAPETASFGETAGPTDDVDMGPAPETASFGETAAE